ncbi:MAG TPA: hypothetical protein VHU89_05790 [Acidobacteriaceae bacterium]|jgi:hypothetical protein|nr:hypothetical protein [Acidobacteriaceae bacterium]
MSAAEALLGRIVDYAGLFPPAALDMATAVRDYQEYLGGEHGWMLGSFVVSAPRLEEFAAAFDQVCCGEKENPWTLSIVCAGASADDARRIAAFRQGAVFIGSLEAKAEDPRAAAEVLERLPAARTRYVEFAPERAAEMLPVLAERGAWAKIRMGGLTPGTIPDVESVAHFLAACMRERVPFKATAGLHHAIRATRALTGNPDGPRAPMHGFLNLFLAAALAYFGADEPAILRTLAEEDASAFSLDDEVIRWHEQTLITDQIERVRSEFAMSFGSCSFTDPVDDMKEMGWI